MKTTCGVIVTDGNKMLLGHSTGNKHWDIPKGCMDEGETTIQTALRELQEETGIVLTEDDLIYLTCVNKYNSKKDLCLFLYKTNSLPDIKNVVCSSIFTKGDKQFPELDRFKYVAYNDVHKYVTYNMMEALKDILIEGY